MESAAQSHDLPKDTMFRPAGGVFKLIPPPHPANNKFKPSGAREVSLAPVAPTTPTEGDGNALEKRRYGRFARRVATWD